MESFKETVTTSQRLEIKPNNKYKKQIKIEKGKTIRGNIVYKQFNDFKNSTEKTSTSFRLVQPNKSRVAIEEKYNECRKKHFEET